jgi:hypothetical protein
MQEPDRAEDGRLAHRHIGVARMTPRSAGLPYRADPTRRTRQEPRATKAIGCPAVIPSGLVRRLDAIALAKEEALREGGVEGSRLGPAGRPLGWGRVISTPALRILVSLTSNTSISPCLYMECGGMTPLWGRDMSRPEKRGRARALQMPNFTERCRSGSDQSAKRGCAPRFAFLKFIIAQ